MDPGTTTCTIPNVHWQNTHMVFHQQMEKPGMFVRDTSQDMFNLLNMCMSYIYRKLDLSTYSQHIQVNIYIYTNPLIGGLHIP